MVDIRKIIIIFVIALLFATLVFATIDAIYPSPEYDDYCSNRPYIEKPNDGSCTEINVSVAERQECIDQNGYIEFINYDSNNCPTSYECNTCNEVYQKEHEKYRQIAFYVTALLSLIAIFIGLFLPAETNMLNEWVGTGFMLGGTFALFIGTAQGYGDLGRIERPIILLLELLLILFIAYKKIGKTNKK